MARRRRFTAEVEVTARDRSAAPVQRAQSRFQRLGNFLKNNLVVSVAGATAAFAALTRIFSSVVEAASVQEQAINSLNAALAKLGPEAGAVSTALQQQAAALQQVTRFGDEAIIKGQALLASFTSNREEIEGATVAALDFAAATDRDLNTAFLTLGKAAAGNTGELSRYGIVLDEGIPKGEKFAAVLEKINEQFGGRAQADVKTYAGAVSQLGNAWGDFLERAGFVITENEGLRQAIENVTFILSKLGKEVENVSDVGFGKMSQALQVLVDQHDELNRAQAGLGRVLDGVGQGFVAGRELVENYLDALRDLGEGPERIREIAGAIDTLRRNGLSAADAIFRLVEAEERARRISKEWADAQRPVNDLLKELGVSIEADVGRQIDEMTEKLDFARRNQDALGLSAQDLVRFERAVAEEAKRLKDELAEQAGTLSDVKDGFDGAGASAGRFASQVGRTIPEVRSLREETDALAASQSRLASAGGRNPSSANADLFGSGLDPLFPGLGLGGGTFTTVRRATTDGAGRVSFV